MSLKLILNKLTSMVLVMCMLLSLAAPAVGEEPLTQPTEETVYSDGSTVYADGTVVYADGTIVYADGTTVHADGTTVNADGTTIYADGTTVYPDGKMVYADGTTVYPDGTTVYADGTVVYANGTIVYADGTTVHADGTTVNADGTTVYPDGTTVYADGTMVYVNGTVAYPDGTVVYPDGTTLNVDGTTVYSDGTTVYADGTTVYADGTTVYTDGTTVYPERTTVYSDGTTVYPDGTTVYPDGTTNSVLEEEQVPLAAPELYAADPVIETEGDNSEENTAVVTENPVTTGQKTVDPLTTTDPASETQPVTDGEAAGGEAKTPPVIPGKEAELAEEAAKAEKTENTEKQESTGAAEPTESEPEEEPEENIEGQTEGNPEETAGDPAEDTEDTTEENPEKTAEETTEDATEDATEDTAEDEPEETAAPAEELPLRTLTVSAGQMAFRDQYLNPTEPVLWSGSVWNWLYGTAIEPSYTDGRVTVEISGRLPENVTARAMFIEFADPSAAQNDERALMLLDVALLDEGGAVYVPTEKLHVSVSAGSIYGAAESGEPFAAYFYDSYDGIGAAGDIKVRLDENIDGSRLAYVPEQNEALRFWEAGGRLVSTGNGTVEFDENRFPFRFVLSAQQEAREEELAETEQENVVKDVSLSGTLVASDGYTYEVSVSYPANCGIPVGAQLSVEELILGSDAYWDYINQSAAELGVSPADLSLARAFDISLVDPETGVHYQPTQDVQVSITLISTPVNTEEEIEVLHFDDEAGQVQAMDVALNGEAIEFATGSFSVFVVLQKNRNILTEGVETKNESSVVTAPTALENLVYNGQEQALVTAGTAEGGTLFYALGENGETAPEDVEGDPSKWSENIPKAVNAKTYYVWYKVVDNEGNDSDVPQCLTVTISPATRNPRVVSVTAGEFNPENNTITYTVVVEAEGDFHDPVTITNTVSGLAYLNGSYIYAHKDGFALPSGANQSQAAGVAISENSETTFEGFPLTVSDLYDGDTITLTFTAEVRNAEYSASFNTAQVNSTISLSYDIDAEDTNISTNTEDDTASYTTTIPYAPLTREYLAQDGSWAYWKVTVNPKGYSLGAGQTLTLLDTFHDGVAGDAGQSIDYGSVKVESSGNVSYDYSGNTGTFVIPDNTPATITYRTHIVAQPGEAVLFRGTAVLRDAGGNMIASATAGATQKEVVIYPSPSEASGSGTNYMLKLFVYADGTMQTGISGAQFILLDANQRALEYKLGDNKGQPVTFTTGEDGYVIISLSEEAGDISIEKNTGYYLEMIKAVDGYQKDNTLYSFMITDDPGYSSGGFYKYYNGDTMKVRLYKASAGLSVSIRFSGSYALREDQQNAVTAVLQILDDNDEWEDVERHPYTDSQWGSIKFNTTLQIGDYYRVIEENQRPWDLPEDIHLETTYYSLINSGTSDPHKEPQEFSVNNADDSVSVVIDNRYEESQLTIVKMDKQTGAVLPGAEFSVFKIVNGAESGDAVKSYETDTEGKLVIRGGEPFASEILYGIVETAAPEHYLLPLTEQWHYFYFCNDEYLEPNILANLPEDATAINLTNSGDNITIDNQKETVTIPVMKIWQGGWPESAEVVVGLYQSVAGGNPTPVLDEENAPRTVTLTSAMPYNNRAFVNLPSRDDQNRSITYSIKEESINGQNPLDAGYVQEYGISGAGVYVVRNKPATTLSVNKEWYDFEGNKIEDAIQLKSQSPVTFDVYRSVEKIPDEVRLDGITNAEMAGFVSGLLKVFENQSIENPNWSISIRDLDKQDNLGQHYYYYVLETVPSFGNELYEVNEENGTVTIQNKIAPETVNLTVTKAALVDDPRPESLARDFEFTLKLNNDLYPIRGWQVYTDAMDSANNLVTDWNGEVTFTLKPTNPDPALQPTEGSAITLNLPAGVTATVTESYLSEYTVATTATTSGSTADNGRTFSYVTSSETDNVALTYINTLRVICKVVKDDGTPEPFESLKSALAYIRANSSSFTAPWTIFLLEDYTIPVTDEVSVRAGENLTLTTAPTDATDGFPFKGGAETDRAVITRGGAGGSMLKNVGTLTLKKICLDGGNITATGDGGLVNSTGTLNLNAGAVLRHSIASSRGGAVYAEGTVNIVDGVSITGNSSSSASALYLKGTLNMTGGSITGNTGASDGAVVAEYAGDLINLSGNPVIFNNTNTQSKAANLYVGADSDSIMNVVSPGLGTDARIGVSARDGHMQIGEQFATTEFEVTANLDRFINDAYGYRGKLKDGTSTNVVWDGLTMTIKKVVDPIGANPNDRFRITLSSPSIAVNSYIIDGTLDYTISAARQNRPGMIIFTNVKAGDEYTISPLPVGDYTITEEASNYTPSYGVAKTGSSEGQSTDSFSAEDDCTVTVTNTRRLAKVNLTKTLDDRLKTADETQDFVFTVKLTEVDGTAVSGFALTEGITTNTSGEATITLSPSNNTPAELENLNVPVGAIMTITETANENYNITASALTMPTEGEGVTITDADADNTNVFAFAVTDDGASVTFANVRKMAEIELSKKLTGKVSATESFTFTVTLTRADGDPAASYMMYRDDNDSTKNIVTDENGKATITFDFGRGESSKAITLTIPEGTKLEVEENAVKKTVGNEQQNIYNTNYSINEAATTTDLKATINPVSDSDHSIAFSNARKMQNITVKNTVSGYSGNVVPFTYTATVTDGGEGTDDYDENGFTDGVMTFDLTTGQSQVLTVPYGATLNVEQTFIVGYDTTVSPSNYSVDNNPRKNEFQVTKDLTLNFTNTQLIGLRLVNNTSATLENVKVTITPNDTGIVTKIFRVNSDQTDQEKINDGTNKYAMLSIASGETVILEISHKNSVTHMQDYRVEGVGPAKGYYYTINNEPSFHEYANPAILRFYDKEDFSVRGGLRYSVQDSIVTFTEQPLVSFDANGGTWTTEMEGYRDRDGDRKVYQFAVTSGEAVSAPSPAPVYPTAEEIAFLGWTQDETFAKTAHTASEDVSEKLYTFDSAVTTPITLYAIWARDPNVRTVTVKNGLNTDLTVNVTLTNDDPSGASYTIFEDVDDPSNNITTDESGEAIFTLTAGETKNLRVPNGAKLVLSAENAMAVSTGYTDDDGSIDGSFTINKVEKDGTVSFIGGICKITDSEGNILYDVDGQPAVYGTFAAAFTAYVGTLYTDASHTTTDTPAAVKLLVDEYIIQEATPIAFPNAAMTLTTAGKDDTDFPYVGVRDRATIYRSAAGANNNCFTLATGNITLTNIVLDGGSEQGVKIAKAKNGGLIYMNQASGVLNIEEGTTLRNCAFAAYDSGNQSAGGAISMTNGTLNVHAGLFSNLQARRGGAINVTGGTLNITRTAGSIRFENCVTSSTSDGNNGGDGGAIYYSAANPVTIKGGDDKDNPGVVFVGCVSGSQWGDGGAIFAAPATQDTYSVAIFGCTFSECSARMNKSNNADSGNGGGAINAFRVNGLTVSYCSFSDCDSMWCGGAITSKVKNGSTVSIEKCSFESCNSRAQGGAIATYQVSNSNSAATLKLTDCTLNNCSSGTENGSGGAIQCYLPRLEFTRTHFADCWAGKEGGAVNNYYGNVNNDTWSGSYLKVDGCSFIRCRAEDRYDVTGLVHYGGAINSKVQTAEVTDSYFEDCVSTLKQGGALHLWGAGTSSKAKIENTTFKNCKAKSNGGALLASNETLEIIGSKFYGCSSFAENGGAVLHGNNSRFSSTQNTTMITNCVFSADPNSSNGEACSAAGNGGAIWTRAQAVTISGCTITGSSANGNGGAIYLSKNSSQSATISGGTITGCSAANGSAVYAEHNATFSGDLSVTGNTVSNINDGAIHGGTLYFEGNVKVQDNTCSADSSFDHDVLMQNNNNTTIYTTANGLGTEANIGVYVTDAQLNGHGLEGKPFGTWVEGGSDLLESFFNDRDDNVYGYQWSATDKNIYWGIYVCKITDAKGSTLKRTNGRDAVYQRLTMALDEFTSVKNENGETDKAVYIKMLVQDYHIQQEATITNFPTADITLTTEAYTGTDPVAGKYDGKHPYRGTPGTVCTISRDTRYNGSNQLFKLSNANTKFQLENIILDGRKDKTATQGNYRLIEATAGKVIVNGGTTFQYGFTSGSGGAINISYANASLEIHSAGSNNVLFDHCIQQNDNDYGGGAIYSVNTVTIDSKGGGKTIFTDCNAKRGGAIMVNNNSADVYLSLADAEFKNCHSVSEGGAVYHNNNNNSTASTTLQNCSFVNCYSVDNEKWSYGGAVDTKTAYLTVENSSFTNCYARSNGGAINHDSNESDRVRTTITNTTFDGCCTVGTSNSYGYGGSISTWAKEVELTGSTFKNSTSTNHGGALYLQSKAIDSVATITGTSFENCSTTREGGYGGAIYSLNKALTLQKSEKAETTINACTAPGYSGAVYMATENSILNISDGTVISSCYADKGGAIYLKNKVTLNLTGSPEFTRNGFTTQSGSIVNATEGACIYLVEGSRINLSGSPKFSRNILPNLDRIPNGGVTDFVRQDLYLAGYSSNTAYDTNAASIYVVGELTGDTIWVWPEQAPHRLPNEQFAKIADDVTVTDETLSHLRNSLADNVTTCTNGEYLAGVQINAANKNIYWDKMYTISFRKIDNKGVMVPDAEFTLYTDKDCTNAVATAISADGENDTGAQGNLLARGTVEFTSVRIGVYYMKETKVPTSFRENNATYLVLVGTPYLSPNDNNKSLWEGDGPLNVTDAATLVQRHTTDAGKYYAVFPLDENNKAVLRANLTSNSVGIENIRSDYQIFFMKVDGNHKALPGAAFTIYTAILDSNGDPSFFEDGYPQLMLWSRDGENYPAPVVSADGTSAYRDVNNNTLAKGLVYFRELPLGTYYLLETAYPERNGDGRHAFYAESDRVLKLDIAEDSNDQTKIRVTLSEWKLNSEGTSSYEELEKDDNLYVVTNQEVVCKLTDASDNLLYVEGHTVWERNEDGTGTVRLFPAVYPTLEEGFEAAQNGTFVYANGETADVDALKLKVLKDFTIDSPITYYNNKRALTFTTAETRAQKDRYVFSTSRTSDTSRAEIKRNYNSAPLITVQNGASLMLQNIKLNGQKSNYTGRAIHITEGGSLTVLNNAQLLNFRQNSAQGGAILMEEGTRLTVNGGSSRTAVFSDNEATGGNGGAIAVGENCAISIANAQFTGNKAENGNGGALSVDKRGEEAPEIPLVNVVFSNNTARNGGAVYTGENVLLKAENNIFTNNVASNGNGGAIFAGKVSEVTLLNASIRSNSAESGSAIYGDSTDAEQDDGAKIWISGGIITGNKASDSDGGAINVGGMNARIYFSGNPYVFGNTDPDGTQQKNVVLSRDSNGIIWTGEAGLTGGRIGVYVAGPLTGQLFDDHGQPSKPFGTFGDQGRMNPQVFTNDRNPDLHGVAKEDDNSDYTIYWSGVEGAAHVMLVKVQESGTSYKALSGKRFTVYSVYTDSAKTVAQGTIINNNGMEEEKTLSDLPSGIGGAFFIGKMPYGTYYVTEEGIDGTFEITIDQGGVVKITDSSTTPKTTEPVKTVNLS